MIQCEKDFPGLMGAWELWKLARVVGSLYAVFKLKRLRAKVWESTYDP